MLALGRYPDITLKRARELHQEARKLVANGINPVHHKQQASLKTTLSNFGTLAQAWQDTSSTKIRQATIDQRRRELDKHLLPRFKSRDANSLTRPELAQFLTTLAKQTPETARNLRSHLSSIFEYGIDIGAITTNPTPPTRVLRARQPKHHPSLAADRTGNFLRALDDCRASEETRIAMLLVLLTACRKNEVVEAEWNEFDLKNMSWTIPASRMKAKREHWVPLSTQSISLLKNLQQLTGKRKHLFPNRVDPTRPMANRTLNALLDRLGYGGESTPHGMRAAFSTYFNKQGANVDVIEYCLAHIPTDKVRAAYNRHVYQDERRTMLQSWADYVDSQRA
jgi:integrase